MKGMLKRGIIILVFILGFLCLGTLVSKAGDLSLKQLDIQAEIQEDGNMDVVETWNINIEDTNTLYKSFETDRSKYSGITNVKVKEITGGKQKSFSEINEWVYHVTEGCYYGTENKQGDFEIGWGVDLEDKKATRQYQISYTVEDAITKYEDYAELYWQFIGKDFEINCKNITGTITLPEKVTNLDQIKVWGHTEDLNGTIRAMGKDRIEFKIDSFRAGRFVEVRTLFPSDMIFYAQRTQEDEILEQAIREETVWANAANQKRQRKQMTRNIVNYVVLFLEIGVAIFLVFKLMKYRNILKEAKAHKLVPTQEIKYYREIPNEKQTITETISLVKEKGGDITTDEFGKCFAAILLNLSLKKYIEFEVRQKQDKNKEDVLIKLTNKTEEELEDFYDEKKVYVFLTNACGENKQITVKEFKKYMEKKAKEIEKMKNSIDSQTSNVLIEKGYIHKENKAKDLAYSAYVIFYLIAEIMAIFSFKLLLPQWRIVPGILIVLLLLCCIFVVNIKRNLNVMTQKGIDEIQQWNGLKNYMQDFSMLDKREVPEIVIWEKFLVYATAFGIADKVIKQLKIVYPTEVEQMTNMNYAYFYLMLHTDFNSSFSNSISSAMVTTYSSATGGGGGFSGGGGFGGGRRRWWRKIILLDYRSQI